MGTWGKLLPIRNEGRRIKGSNKFPGESQGRRNTPSWEEKIPRKLKTQKIIPRKGKIRPIEPS